MMNIFERAVLNKYRFASSKGDLTVEQLFDAKMPLLSRDGFNLDAIAKTVNAELREITEESFVSTANPRKADLEYKLEIVKEAIARRQAAIAAVEAAQEKATKRAIIQDALSAAENRDLAQKSPEELREMLNSL